MPNTTDMPTATMVSIGPIGPAACTPFMVTTCIDGTGAHGPYRRP